MPSTLENVFIFGVILPAVITVIVFAIFLVCWFKCNIREKLQHKFCRKKSQDSTSQCSGTDDATKSQKGVHYIHETLDCSGSTGNESRHSHRENPQVVQAIPMHDTGHLANMGFEIGEDYSHSSSYTGSARGYAAHMDQNSAGPSTSYHSPGSYNFTNNRPISSSSPVERKAVYNIKTGNDVTVHMDSETAFTELGDNKSNMQTHGSKSHTVSSTTNMYSSPAHSSAYSATTAQNTQTPHSQSLSQGDHQRQFGHSPHLSDNVRLSSDVTPGVHKPVMKSPSQSHKHPQPGKRGEYIQQVFQFPHSSRHHKALTKISRNTAASSSLDNSSSSYSSCSNDGDYFDREGDYGQFYPVSQCTTEPQSTNSEVMYTRHSSSRSIGNKNKPKNSNHRGNSCEESSKMNYHEGHQIVKSVYNQKNLDGLVESSKFGQSISSATHFSPYQYGHRPDTKTELHFISQDI